MSLDKESINARIAEIEASMSKADFWTDKNAAQGMIRELAELREKLSGIGRYDKGNAVMTIFSGAGGDDAEDFSAMLLRMYLAYFKRKNWATSVIHEHKNDHGGYRNVTIEVAGKGAYGILKKESGVHRLVRLSPFNSKKLRHTSFSMVEVIPKFAKTDAQEIPMSESDLRIEFSRSSGPGGQNVNKRETAVRIVHLPTNFAVHVDTERSQEQNREIAMNMLRAKLYRKLEEDRQAKEHGMYISKTTDIEWGNQIRSYVLHPYKMVKDHRTNVETSNVENVLEEGDLDAFIEAEGAL